MESKLFSPRNTILMVEGFLPWLLSDSERVRVSVADAPSSELESPGAPTLAAEAAGNDCISLVHE